MKLIPGATVSVSPNGQLVIKVGESFRKVAMLTHAEQIALFREMPAEITAHVKPARPL